MWLSCVPQGILRFILLSNFVLASAPASALSTSGRFIVNASGKRVKLRCVNCELVACLLLQVPKRNFQLTSFTGAGADHTKIPKRLNWQPVDAIATWLAEAGFNCVRLTYSIDLALDPKQKVSAAFTAAADGTGDLANVTDIFNTAVGKNPWLSTASTLDTYTVVISALEAYGVMVILDNHNSHASWCCSLTDGNGLLSSASGYSATNSRYFNTDHWLSGLSAMAKLLARSSQGYRSLSSERASRRRRPGWSKYVTCRLVQVCFSGCCYSPCWDSRCADCEYIF